VGAGTVKIAAPLEQVLNFNRRWNGTVVDGYAIVEGIPTLPDFEKTGVAVHNAIRDNFGIPTSIAIGCFGPLNLMTKKIIKSPNLPEWEGCYFTVWEDIFDLKITLDNDANCAILGEAVHGAGKDYRYVVGLTLGSGIGGSEVINGEIKHGLWDLELGHMCLDPDGPRCGCGQYGCLEAYISTNALRQKFGAEPRDLADRPEVWQYYAKYLGRACEIITMCNNPEVIVLCGGIAKQPGLLELVIAVYQSLIRVFPEEASLPRIVIGHFVQHSGVIGAVELARRAT